MQARPTSNRIQGSKAKIFKLIFALEYVSAIRKAFFVFCRYAVFIQDIARQESLDRIFFQICVCHTKSLFFCRYAVFMQDIARRESFRASI